MRASLCKASLVAALLVAAPVVRAADAPTPPPGVHFVYLVRHGMYDREEGADDRAGNALNALGHDQARLIGKRLAAAGVKYRSLVASDFKRALETAEDMGSVMRMTPVLDSLIHECTPGTDRPETNAGQTPDEIALCESNLAAAFAKYFVPTPEADTWDVLVCHGNVIRWLTVKALGADLRRWYANDIGHASLTVIAVRPDGTCRLVMYSDVGHIPLEKQTWAGRGPGWMKRAAPRTMK